MNHPETKTPFIDLFVSAPMPVPGDSWSTEPWRWGGGHKTKVVLSNRGKTKTGPAFSARSPSPRCYMTVSYSPYPPPTSHLHWEGQRSPRLLVVNSSLPLCHLVPWRSFCPCLAVTLSLGSHFVPATWSPCPLAVISSLPCRHLVP